MSIKQYRGGHYNYSCQMGGGSLKFAHNLGVFESCLKLARIKSTATLPVHYIQNFYITKC